MSNLQDLVNADRRLGILRVLAGSTAYTASADLLRAVLASLGHAVSHDRLNTDLEWLHEQDLVGLERIGDVPIARATQRGVDVAAGLATVPGVAKPGPV
jgi:hypothetical protein